MAMKGIPEISIYKSVELNLSPDSVGCRPYPSAKTTKLPGVGTLSLDAERNFKIRHFIIVGSFLFIPHMVEQC